MDRKVKKEGDFAFQILKNIIIAENKILFEKIEKKYKLHDLEKKYLKPEYYLPIIDEATSNCHSSKKQGN